MDQANSVLLCYSNLDYTFVHLTFNQVVAGSIPARPTKYEALKHLWKLK